MADSDVTKIAEAFAADFKKRISALPDFEETLSFAEAFVAKYESNPVVVASRLRETLLAMPASAGHENARARYLKTERAIRAFLDGAEIRRIFAADEEMFPLPGEATATTKKRRMAK